MFGITEYVNLCPSEAPDVLGHELKPPAPHVESTWPYQPPPHDAMARPGKTKKTSEKLDEHRFNGYK